MTIRNIDKEKTEWLTINDLENFFQIYQDKFDNYFYNLNKGLYIAADITNLEQYQLTHDMHWTLISYNIYGTTRLAWLLMKINNISLDYAFQKIPAGTRVFYLSISSVTEIIKYLNNLQ